MNAPLVPPPDYAEPIPLVIEDADTPYPLSALGEVLGGAAKAIVEIVQVPAALAAQSVLAAAAMAAQPHANVLRAGQPIPLSLFALTIAESGDRKSAADRLALRAHQERQQTLLETYREALTVYRKRRDANQSVRGQALEKPTGKAEKPAAELVDQEEPQPPPLPFILAEDPTLEGLQKSFLLGQASQGLFSDEGGLFFGGHAGKPENLLKSASGLSSLWDGSPIRRLRAVEGESAARAGCRLSVHLMIQPVVAREVLSNPILQGQGFLARFLVAWPQSLAGTRLYRDLNPDEDVCLNRYWQRMAQLLARTPALDAHEGLAPPSLTLEAPALAAWIEVHNRIETRLGKGGELQEIKPMAAKGAENVLRMAGVMTVVEESEAITCELIERAAMLMEWYLGEALRVVNPAQTDSRTLLAQRLLEWLLANDWQRFEARRLQREGPRLVRKSARQRDELLGILVEHRQLFSPDGRVFVLSPLATAATPATGQTPRASGTGEAMATTGDTDSENAELSPTVAHASQP
ncbi:MAG TPA: YfjI family protein [Pseudomonas sp.]|uniref:YfjI family protein n=1 Tax=Pseudomonas sp. TaxID=306 RepID=UPI002B704776|nr:YfjI family protein [Pseudomonas sp.]HTO20175.1 YfjI family protein [Pseudomonas sp.]